MNQSIKLVINFEVKLSSMKKPQTTWKKVCYIPDCKNNTETTPCKIFLKVPSYDKTRCKEWYAAAGYSGQPAKRKLYCCEDHFDLEKDASNWIYFKTIGSRVCLREGVVPHRNLKKPFELRTKTSQFSSFDRHKRDENIQQFISKAKEPISQQKQLREDMENYVRYSLTGAPIKIQKGVLPHFFDCQEQRTNKKRPAPRSAYLKLNRKREIDSILSSVKSNKDVNDSTKTEMPLMKKCKEDKDDSKRHTSNSVIIINSLEGGIANYRYFKEMNYMDWIPPLVPLTRRLDCQRFSEQTHISDSDDEEVEIKMEIIDEPVGMVSNCEVKLLDNSEVKLDNNKEETRWGNFIPYISNFVKVDIEHNEDEENLQEENQPPFAFVEVKTESI